VPTEVVTLPFETLRLRIKSLPQFGVLVLPVVLIGHMVKLIWGRVTVSALPSRVLGMELCKLRSNKPHYLEEAKDLARPRSRY
jgi:hypothetical protein